MWLGYECPLVNHIHKRHLGNFEYNMLLLKFMFAKLDFAAKEINRTYCVCVCVRACMFVCVCAPKITVYCVK